MVSACLILKNEEDNLPRCLGALKPAVDEIVVVDTGSTDRTAAIAEELGARVFHFEWCDDFSAARNESLKHATGEWIIWIDGDDELIESQPGALRELCSAAHAPDWGYWADVRSPYGLTGDQEVMVRHWRIFRNGRGIAFRGRIHEEPWPPTRIHPDDVASQQEVRIDHWGYLPDAELQQRKAARNRRLLERCVEEEPWQPAHYYNLGRHYIREGDNEAALRTLEQGLDLWFTYGPPNWLSAHSLLSFAARAAADLGQYDKVLDIEARTPAELVSAELLCSAGTACWRLGRREDAIQRLNRAWQDPSVAKAHLHDRSKSTWQPLLMLTGLYDQTGRADQAYASASQAHDFAPDHPEILLALGYLADKLGRRDESAAWLSRLLDGPRDEGFKPQGRRLLLNIARQTNAPALAVRALQGEVEELDSEQRALLCAEAYADLGDTQAQYDSLTDAAREHPHSAVIHIALAELLAEQGFAGEALSTLAPMLDGPAAPANVYRCLSKLLAKQGRLEDAANALQLALQTTELALSAATS